MFTRSCGVARSKRTAFSCTVALPANFDASSAVARPNMAARSWIEARARRLATSSGDAISSNHCPMITAASPAVPPSSTTSSGVICSERYFSTVPMAPAVSSPVVVGRLRMAKKPTTTMTMRLAVTRRVLEVVVMVTTSFGLGSTNCRLLLVLQLNGDGVDEKMYKSVY